MPPPIVFLSAVTGDFGLKFLHELRVCIDDQGCHCRYRGNLKQSGMILPEKLQSEIRDASCVIHLVGPRFGYGPDDVPHPDIERTPAGEFWKPACMTWWPLGDLPVRRSFTQMEFDFASELKKPVFVIFVDDPALIAAAKDLSPDEAHLQAQHRRAIEARGHEWARTDSVATLSTLAEKLPIIVNHLKQQIVELRDVIGSVDQRLARIESAVANDSEPMSQNLPVSPIVAGTGIFGLIALLIWAFGFLFPAVPIGSTPPQPPPPPSAWTEVEALKWVQDSGGSATALREGKVVDVGPAFDVEQPFGIVSINLSDSQGDMDSSIIRLRGLPLLSDLDLSWTKLSDKGATDLQHLPWLTVLNIQGCPVGVDGFKTVGALTNLTSLRIGDTRLANEGAQQDVSMQKLTDTELDGFQQSKKLEYLYLSSFSVTDAGVSKLVAEFENLVELQIDFVSLRSTGKESAIESLSKLQYLSNLSLIKTGLDNGAIEGLAKLMALKQLNIQGTLINSEGVKRLREEDHLKDKPIYGGEYSPKRNAVKAIVHAGGSVNISAFGQEPLVIDLKNFEALPDDFTTQQIDLSNVEMLSPDLLQLKEATRLIGTKYAISVHDAELLSRQLPSLIYLDLSNTTVGDAEIAALGQMRRLQEINLNKTRVTEAGRSAFIEKNRGRKIEFTP